MEVADDPAQTEPSSPSVKTKWGSVVTGGRNGYQILPDALVRNQGALGLTCTDMVVLVNILMHWWEREPQKMPHPRPEQIAKRMGATVRTVQRSISRLCRAELLEWMPAEKSVAGPAVRSFNVKGLKAKLKHFAQQVEVLDENAV